jgi:hypothetical protein
LWRPWRSKQMKIQRIVPPLFESDLAFSCCGSEDNRNGVSCAGEWWWWWTML